MAHRGNVYPYVSPGLRLLRYVDPPATNAKGTWYPPARWTVAEWGLTGGDFPPTYPSDSAECVLSPDGTTLTWTWEEVAYSGHTWQAIMTWYLSGRWPIVKEYLMVQRDGVNYYEGVLEDDFKNETAAPNSLIPDWTDDEGFDTGYRFHGGTPKPW